MSYNIAVDGPAGAGKSTIARAVAKRLGIIYVDTGAMYRAIGLHILRQGIDPGDEQAVIAGCDNAVITLKYEDGVQVVCLNGENVNACIRTEEVGKVTSQVSALPAVRSRIIALQKELAAREDCIMDGRDIGTCVLPDADVKIYLTASSAVRARRRCDELSARGQTCDLAQIQADMEERDYRDMHREANPLRQAEDAVLVDSSDMTPDQVIDRILELCGRQEG